MSKRVLVCGDRNWKDREAIERELEILDAQEGIEVVIAGGCRGADALAVGIARELDLPVEEYPADWDTHGKAAGPIRNREMIEKGRPDLVLAFHPEIKYSKGTRNMVEQAKLADVPVRVIPR